MIKRYLVVSLKVRRPRLPDFICVLDHSSPETLLYIHSQMMYYCHDQLCDRACRDMTLGDYVVSQCEGDIETKILLEMNHIQKKPFRMQSCAVCAGCMYE